MEWLPGVSVIAPETTASNRVEGAVSFFAVPLHETIIGVACHPLAFGPGDLF